MKSLMTHYSYIKMQSPLGEIVLTSSNESITGLYTCEHSFFIEAQNGLNDSQDKTLDKASDKPKCLQEAIKQLNEYFEKKRTVFDLPLSPKGSEFQKRVWKALNDIPYGKTKTYGEIAKLLDDSNASRAVGLANSKNPICIIIPCHRVVGANGKLSGYAGGIQAKDWLLKHETEDAVKSEQMLIGC